jgi:hypothetical protein
VYRLVAARTGWLSVKNEHAASLDGEIALTAKPAYAMRYQLVDEHGQPLLGAGLYSTAFGLATTGNMPGLEYIDGYASFALLAGYPPGEPVESDGSNFVRLLLASADASTCGPFSVAGAPLLYESFSQEVWAWRLGEPRMPDVLVLRSTGEAFGRIELDLRCQQLPDPSRNNALGHLSFEGESRGFDVPLSLRDLLGGRAILVPVGSYKVRYRSGLGGTPLLVHERLVVDEQGVTLPIDLRSLGTLRVTFLRSDGSLELGIVRALVGTGKLNSQSVPLGGTVFLHGPMDEVHGLLPGTYTLLPSHGYPNEEFTVAPNSTVELVLERAE